MLGNLRGSNGHRTDRKFTPAPRLGLQSEGEREYGGFRYRIWHARVGMSSSTIRYSLKITDLGGAPRHYVSGFRSMADAERAAHAWIDEAEVPGLRRGRTRRDGAHRRRR
ncbi:MAG: hypothetical protein DWQ42_13890 [Planctomycetota bacterium]|nr:MAG: hypothetical protein DWQ42_13890 [Planctomycetota bacterium]REK39373.1 MAG: hypothetical protein DWQ46_19045 [Planctomycetota bacterium]